MAFLAAEGAELLGGEVLGGAASAGASAAEGSATGLVGGITNLVDEFFGTGEGTSIIGSGSVGQSERALMQNLTGQGYSTAQAAQLASKMEDEGMLGLGGTLEGGQVARSQNPVGLASQEGIGDKLKRWGKQGIKEIGHAGIQGAGFMAPQFLSQFFMDGGSATSSQAQPEPQYMGLGGTKQLSNTGLFGNHDETNTHITKLNNPYADYELANMFGGDLITGGATRDDVNKAAVAMITNN